MKNAQHINSLVDNKETIIMAHLKSDTKKRRATFHQEPTPWFEYTVMSAVVVALVIIIGEVLI
jgi:hypothetical protein